MTENITRDAWFRAALEQFEEPLLRYARQLTGNAETARDVVQDTFLRLCAANRADVEARLAPWLFTVCRNRAFDVREKEARMKPLNDEDLYRRHPACLTDAGRMPALQCAVAERNERHEMVLAALATLPQNQQEAFRLKFQQDLTYRAISEVMGISLGTVSTLIASALLTLRNRLCAESGPVFPKPGPGVGGSPVLEKPGY